ncbi:MAG: hypothetical protein KBT39_02915 [Bacteroidales bacterium]|nr:hypothetical protein [Bacteroidales bacterium]
MKLYRYILILMAILLVGCDSNLTEDIVTLGGDRSIHVGGVLTDGGRMVVTQTRADGEPEHVRAETVPWMQGALRQGLDITYSNLNSAGSHDRDNEAVAILKWKGTSDPNTHRGDYTFKYKGTENDAEWYDNGPHYFEGEYVPGRIRTTGSNIEATELTTNQADDADYNYTIDDDGTEHTTGTIGNYTLLSHYVGMPPNWTASATVDQILLPFKHRLSRVIVYILIDDQLLALDGSPAVLEGYKGAAHTDAKDDPSTTSLRFANVKVLQYVQETAPTGADAAKKTSTLIPTWTEARRVIPHFCDEFNKSYKNEPDADYPDRRELAVASTEDSKYITPANEAFIVYTNKRDEKKLHPREKDWLKAHKDFVDNGVNSNYTQQMYHRVPIYDVIVRPTYTNEDNVMYDEAGYYNDDKTPNTVNIKNYAKEKNQIEFEMTLNNGLIYTKKFEFDLNANQQTVVYITIDRESIDYDDSAAETWTALDTYDGYYGVNNDLNHNMSIAGSSWQRAVTYTASEPQHSVTDGNFYDDSRVDAGDLGQYFSDTNQWIEEFAKANMGGTRQGHYFVLDTDITIDATKLPDNFVFTGHLDGRGHTITLSNTGKPVYKTATSINSQLYTKNVSSYVAYTIPSQLYTRVLIPATYYSEEEIVKIEGVGYVKSTVTDNGNGTYTANGESVKAEIGDEKTAAYYDYTLLTSPTLDDILHGELFTDQSGTPFVNPSALYEFSHTSAAHLFAGLNGTYDGTAGQYNLHMETGHLVPVMGYRAELYNTTVSGGTFFPTTAVFCGNNLGLSGATVTGYIYNCFDANHVAPNNPLTNKVPIPAY